MTRNGRVTIGGESGLDCFGWQFETVSSSGLVKLVSSGQAVQASSGGQRNSLGLPVTNVRAWTGTGHTQN